MLCHTLRYTHAMFQQMEIPERCDGSPITVLVVDDDPLLADLMSEWVAEKWEVEVAYGGEAAIGTLTPETDVVLLDREMPDVTGSHVLSEIRARGFTPQVMFVSGLNPDFEIIDFPFDDYYVKPVDRPTLQGRIEKLLLRRTYHPEVQAYFVHLAKIEALEAVYAADKLAEHEAYLELRARADELRQRADATLGGRTPHVAEMSKARADD